MFGNVHCTLALSWHQQRRNIFWEKFSWSRKWYWVQELRDIEARTSFPKYDENCARKKKDAVVGWHKVAVGDWSYWSASPTMNCGGAAGQQGRALQWTAPGRPTPQIVGQRYHNEQTPSMSNSGNHLYFGTFHSMSFYDFWVRYKQQLYFSLQMNMNKYTFWNVLQILQKYLAYYSTKLL